MTALTENQKTNIINWVKIAGACIIGFIVAPWIYLSITGMIGIIIAAAVFLIGWNAFPILVDVFANMGLVGIKWAASKNPVETLQRDYNRKSDNLNNYLVSIKEFSASIMTFESKYQKNKVSIAKSPEEKLKFDTILSNMKELLFEREKAYAEAKNALAQYKDEIQRASDIWDMSVEASKMNAAAGFKKNDVIEEIKSKTSLDAIEQNMNLQFATLQTTLLENDDEKVFSRKIIDVQGKARSEAYA